MIQKNNKPYRKRNTALPSLGNTLWDFVRIGYLCFYCWMIVESIYTEWKEDIAGEVIPWTAFLLQVIFSSVAVLFASQLQIEKRNLNISMILTY